MKPAWRRPLCVALTAVLLLLVGGAVRAPVPEARATNAAASRGGPVVAVDAPPAGSTTAVTNPPETTTTTTTPPPPPTPPTPQKVMFIGDSMAFTASEGLAPHGPGFAFEVANEGIMGCGVARGGPYRYFGAVHKSDPRCDGWSDLWRAAVDRTRPTMAVIMVGRWELMDRVHGGHWTNLFDPAYRAYIESELNQAVDIAGSTGARVVLFTTPYYQRGLTGAGGLHPEDDPARVDLVNGIMRTVASNRGVALVDLGAWLSPEARYTRDVGGVRVRSDGVHLTRETGPILAPWLFPQLRVIADTHPAPPHLN